MNLGAFSVSLAVKNIVSSKEFYTKLGFTEFGGDISQNWLILKNGDCIIGLFQGMFDGNILTFNPGWDQNSNIINNYTDIRLIQEKVIQNGITPTSLVEQDSKGPASFTLIDPDGNTILVDQHI